MKTGFPPRTLCRAFILDLRERSIGKYGSDVEFPSRRDRLARIGGHFERNRSQQIAGAHELILFIAQSEQQIVLDVFIERRVAHIADHRAKVAEGRDDVRLKHSRRIARIEFINRPGDILVDFRQHHAEIQGRRQVPKRAQRSVHPVEQRSFLRGLVGDSSGTWPAQSPKSPSRPRMPRSASLRPLKTQPGWTRSARTTFRSSDRRRRCRCEWLPRHWRPRCDTAGTFHGFVDLREIARETVLGAAALESFRAARRTAA